MNKQVRQIEESIEEKKLLRRNESVLVAVSGGVDSMVLLHLLHKFSETHGWKIYIAHLNHQLRGRSSDADERFVRKIATSRQLEFFSERANVEQFAKSNRLSIEMAARQIRHDFLARTAKKLRIKTIALAHHADDQVELFFLRLLRGAGTEGLSGMSWKSKSPSDPSIQLVRPLLGQGKDFLHEFAKEEKIRFREDQSNAGLDFQRNRIRHEVVPLLKRIQPGSTETILRTMEIVFAESNFILGTALEWLIKKGPIPFDRLHIAVQRVCLRLQLRDLGFQSDFDLIERLRLRPEQLVAVNPTHCVFRNANGVVGFHAEPVFSFNELERKIDLSLGKGECFGHLKLSWAFQSREGATFRRVMKSESFDAGKVGARICLRHWRKGDRFQPIGTKTPKKLQDLFTDLKVPRAERHERIVAVTERGDIFWVEGLRIGERFKLDKASKRRLKWQWQDLRASVAVKDEPC